MQGLHFITPSFSLALNQIAGALVGETPHAPTLAQIANERCPVSAAHSCFEDEYGVELGADDETN